MSERLFNLSTLAVTAAMVIATNAIYVAGIIDQETNMLVLGIVLGGGVGTAAGAQAGKKLPPS